MAGLDPPPRRVRPRLSLIGPPRSQWRRRAVTAARQRGEQAGPLHSPLMPALARGGRRQAGGRRRRRAAQAAARPCAAVGHSVIIDGAGARRQHPPRRRGVALSAGEANQPAQSVHAPARAHRPSPVVRLPERGRIRKGRTAPRHVTPDDGSPDLVPDDGVPGDRNRMDQRVKAHRRPRAQTVAARLLADGAELCSWAGPAGSARPSGVSGGNAH